MTFINKQKNYHFRYSIMVTNTQNKVWGYLTNVNRWKEWDTELLDARLLGEFSSGAKGILTPKKGPKLKFHVSELIPNKSYTFVTKLPVGTLEIKRTLRAIDNQVEFTDDIKFTGFLKRFFGYILGEGFKSVMPGVMENFKKIAEKE